jgi:hypothetical protein
MGILFFGMGAMIRANMAGLRNNVINITVRRDPRTG